MNTLLMVIIGIPVTMVLIGKSSTRLDSATPDRFGTRSETKNAAARWLRSVRGGGETEPPTMLDKVLVVAVGSRSSPSARGYVFFSRRAPGRPPLSGPAGFATGPRVRSRPGFPSGDAALLREPAQP